MGVSVDINIYDIPSLTANLKKAVGDSGRLPVEEFLAKAMASYGTVDGDNFYVLNCEYWEDYNDAYNFIEVISTYYGLEYEEAEEVLYDYTHGHRDALSVDEFLEELL